MSQGRTLVSRLPWQEGFARRPRLHSFDDVIPALQSWHDAGVTLAVFSSGSVDAQQSWFGHTPEGDRRRLFSAYFDTVNAGPKREVDSYRKIASALGCDPGAIAFLSDVGAELDAARDAGWSTIGVRRGGEPAASEGVGNHTEIETFAEFSP